MGHVMVEIVEGMEIKDLMAECSDLSKNMDELCNECDDLNKGISELEEQYGEIKEKMESDVLDEERLDEIRQDVESRLQEKREKLGTKEREIETAKEQLDKVVEMCEKQRQRDEEACALAANNPDGANVLNLLHASMTELQTITTMALDAKHRANR